MAYINALRRRGLCHTLAVPSAFSMLYATTGKIFFLLPFAASSLFFLYLTPAFRRKENRIAFATLAIASIPINLRVTAIISHSEIVQIISGGHSAIKVLIALLLFGTLFSVEQVVTGVIVRIIWPDQESMWIPAYMEEMLSTDTAIREKEEDK